MSGSIVREGAHRGSKNRPPARDLADRGRCGRRQTALSPLADPPEVDAARARARDPELRLVGWALSGPDRSWRPDLEPAFKLRWDTGMRFGAGIEYYSGLGLLGALPERAEQDHYLYLTGDLVDAPFDLNVGVGRGLTAATSAWLFKTILGVGF